MEHLKDLKKGKTLLGFVCTLISKTFLGVVDVLSVGACLWTGFWLIYLIFVKDSAEIIAYVIARYVWRLKWLYKILRMSALFELSAANPPSPVTPRHSSGRDLTMLRFYQSADYSAISNTERELSGCSQDSSHTKVPSCFPSTSCLNNRSENLSGIKSFIIDETTFENVALNDEEKTDTVPVSTKSPEEKFSLKRTLSWNLNKNKLRDSLHDNKFFSVDKIRTKCENLSSHVAKVLPDQAQDNEKLLPRDSPESGCFAIMSRSFRAKFQMSPIAHSSKQYERF